MNKNLILSIFFLVSCTLHSYRWGHGENIDEFTATMASNHYTEITQQIPQITYSNPEYKAKHFKYINAAFYHSVLYNEKTREIYTITDPESIEELKLGAIHFEHVIKDQEKK